MRRATFVGILWIFVIILLIVDMALSAITFDWFTLFVEAMALGIIGVLSNELIKPRVPPMYCGVDWGKEESWDEKLG